MNSLFLVFLFVCAFLLQCSSAFDLNDFELYDIHPRFKRQRYPGMGFPGGRPYPGGRPFPGRPYPGGRPFPGYGYPGFGHGGARPWG